MAGGGEAGAGWGEAVARAVDSVEVAASLVGMVEMERARERAQRKAVALAKQAIEKVTAMEVEAMAAAAAVAAVAAMAAWDLQSALVAQVALVMVFLCARSCHGRQNEMRRRH